MDKKGMVWWAIVVILIVIIVVVVFISFFISISPSAQGAIADFARGMN